jgi:hypothetical protein
VVTADHQAIVALQNAGVVVISSHAVQVGNSYLVSTRSVHLQICCQEGPFNSLFP